MSRFKAICILLSTFFFTCVSSSSSNEVAWPPHSPTSRGHCPEDAVKFGVCGDWLGLVHGVIGAKPSAKCCALFVGIMNVEAAVCVCTAIRTNVMNIFKFDVPIAISLVLNSCGKAVPPGFRC